MYGKHFEHMYEGSMVGSGPVVFAVMGYIIAKQKPSRIHGSWVELNPKLLAYILGAEEKEVQEAVEKLCSPDPDSRTPDEEGRRLVRLGQFSYQVVNGAKYRMVRNEEVRREQTREAVRRHRAKKKAKESALPGEQEYVQAQENGATQEQLDTIVTDNLPPKLQETHEQPEYQ